MNYGSSLVLQRTAGKHQTLLQDLTVSHTGQERKANYWHLNYHYFHFHLKNENCYYKEDVFLIMYNYVFIGDLPGKVEELRIIFRDFTDNIRKNH